MVKPGGTGRPRLHISARLAPLPPSRFLSPARPSAAPSPKVKTHLVMHSSPVAGDWKDWRNEWFRPCPTLERYDAAVRKASAGKAVWPLQSIKEKPCSGMRQKDLPPHGPATRT